MKLRKMMMTTVAAAMLTLSAAGASFASGLGTINAGALLQQHPQYAKTMATCSPMSNRLSRISRKN